MIYRATHKEQIKESRQQSYQANRDKINEQRQNTRKHKDATEAIPTNNPYYHTSTYPTIRIL